MDLSQYDLGAELIRTLTFDTDTRWSAKDQEIAQTTLELGKRLTFGLEALHQQGITGSGINVGIIDQDLDPDHPEIKGKIVSYTDLGTGHEPAVSFHGPAVTSILAGNTIGTAPGVNVYYAAVPSWKLDAQYYANALDLLVEESATLPSDQKIRVISVSAAPAGIWSKYDHQEAWTAAYARATQAGILVLDCTFEKGVTLACSENLDDPRNIQECTPNWEPGPTSPLPRINIPTTRTVASESLVEGKVQYEYRFTGYGALSWSTPYLAGVLALGWQINPRLSNEEILHLIYTSAATIGDGQKVIDPVSFIELVKATTEY
jgi:subtilisin family serine protease